MFFVSEEFLRRYQQDKENIHSTLGEVVAPGESLFDTSKPRDKTARYREVKAATGDAEGEEPAPEQASQD
ncbi:MAG: hypothetical protein HY330_03670 [Chloroflexi bacterium]|nr:hypothetical protein [Chloroflexota bacterium]